MSSAGPKSYLLGMTSYIYCLGRSSVWWNVTRWGFGSWKVPDPQRRPFPRREPNPRRSSVRSPIRCISPELANTIAMNPGGRPKEVNRTDTLALLLVLISEINVDVYIFVHLDMCPPVLLSPETHAQLQGSVWGNGWGSLSAPLRLLVVRPYPNPCLPCLATNPLLQPE